MDPSPQELSSSTKETPKENIYSLGAQKAELPAPVSDQKLLEEAHTFSARHQASKIRDELGLPLEKSDSELAQYEQYLPEYLQVQSAQEAGPKQHVRRLFLNELARAVEQKIVPPFLAGDPLGEWLVATLRAQGYQIDLRDDTPQGLTIVSNVEKIQSQTETLIETQKEKTAESVAESLLDSTVALERDVAGISVSEGGILVFPEMLRGHEKNQLERIEELKKLQGVLDAQLILGCIVAVYNADEYVPAGFPDLRKQGRTGEYNPREQIVYVDVSKIVAQKIPHEVRHYLVNYLDHKIAHHIQGEPVDRYNKDEAMQQNEQFLQLAYLDELHSHFFEYLEGGSVNVFQNAKSEMYSTSQAQELFTHLQGLIMYHEFAQAISDDAKKEKIEDTLRKAGSALALGRNVTQALELIKTELATLKNDTELAPSFHAFCASYKPNSERFTPELSVNVKMLID